MYKHLFNYEKQIEMREYFVDLSKRIGTTRSYKKNDVIDFDSSCFVGIVINGTATENVISSKGKIHSLFILKRGEVLGETFYFCGGENVIVPIAKEDVDISFLNNEKLDNELIKYPAAYRYFIHSITRKYRIVMLHLTNMIFNDSMGKIADSLIRLSSCSDDDPLGRTIVDVDFTHQELANSIGCSRVTVTNCLKELADTGIIRFCGKKIIINELQVLRTYVDTIL